MREENGVFSPLHFYQQHFPLSTELERLIDSLEVLTVRISLPFLEINDSHGILFSKDLRNNMSPCDTVNYRSLTAWIIISRVDFFHLDSWTFKT